jgi:excisionase family DNA binding protein
MDTKVTDWAALPLMLTPEQARKILQIGKNAIYQALNSGEIPYVRIGRLLRIPREAWRAKLEKTSR